MNGKSWDTWAHDNWSGLNDLEVSALLWQCPSYPFGLLNEVKTEFLAIKRRAQGDVLAALEYAAERVEYEQIHW